MSFHLSAENIRIDGDHVLVAQLKNDDGELIDSSIDLDEILGNDDDMELFPILPLPGSLSCI